MYSESVQRGKEWGPYNTPSVFNGLLMIQWPSSHYMGIVLVSSIKSSSGLLKHTEYIPWNVQPWHYIRKGCNFCHQFIYLQGIRHFPI